MQVRPLKPKPLKMTAVDALRFASILFHPGKLMVSLPLHKELMLAGLGTLASSR
jgi:hypothetical protein